MNKITQEAYNRQRVIKWAKGHGVTAAANRYHMSRKTIHKWLKRYDGSIESLKDRSRRPHHMPRKQSPAEETLVERYARRYRGDLLLGYEKAVGKGYVRSYGCFKRTAARLVKPGRVKSSVRKNKPYQRAEYPGCLLYTSDAADEL